MASHSPLPLGERPVRARSLSNCILRIRGGPRAALAPPPHLTSPEGEGLEAAGYSTGPRFLRRARKKSFSRTELSSANTPPVTDGRQWQVGCSKNLGP